ncbi:hypothetical protein T265_02174 [Opisthorchis viverrini]|uniref:Uncharacterized protein n=1 Tax=Opisthorchis viverrini TaxID=6198 RepID=A0A074ZW72_OPIVI|nr:hypothetical protein T265_02174 [Opisthorchis viverrini]KER31668.1 hypothetical protein T265_02174 [Opisthorchis viverrini]
MSASIIDHYLGFDNLAVSKPSYIVPLAWQLGTEAVSYSVDCEFIIIIDSMISVFNTDASLPYKHDLFESLIVKKRIKVDGEGT